MRGTIDIDGKDILIRYADCLRSEPTEVVMWWKPTDIRRNPYRPGFPQQGDEVDGAGDWWTGPGYSLRLAGNTVAVRSERHPVPCPKVRKGTETRWRDGAWEKLMAKGWVRA